MCAVIQAKDMSYVPDKSSMFSKNATKKVGRTATVRVRRTLCQRFHVKFKNPSIANCPAYVPVIVELWPAAKMPIAQMYLQMIETIIT